MAGRGGKPTLSYLSLVLTNVDQSGSYECSPSNTGTDQVTVHIVQGKINLLKIHNISTILQHLHCTKLSLKTDISFGAKFRSSSYVTSISGNDLNTNSKCTKPSREYCMMVMNFEGEITLMLLYSKVNIVVVKICS